MNYNIMAGLRWHSNRRLARFCRTARATTGCDSPPRKRLERSLSKTVLPPYCRDQMDTRFRTRCRCECRCPTDSLNSVYIRELAFAITELGGGDGLARPIVLSFGLPAVQDHAIHSILPSSPLKGDRLEISAPIACTACISDEGFGTQAGARGSTWRHMALAN